MNKFIFVTENVEELEDNRVKFTGTALGEMMIPGAEADIYGMSGGKVRATVVEAAYDDSLGVTCKGDEKAAYIILMNKEDRKYSKFDVISNMTIDAKNAATLDEVKAHMDNTRFSALVWKYKNEISNEVLGAVFQDIAVCARFYVVAQEINDKKRGGISFPTLQTKNKKRYYAAFSSQEELAKSPKQDGTKVVILGFDDFVAMLHKDAMASGLVIDPFSINLVLDRKTIAHIRDKKAQLTGNLTKEQFTENERVGLTTPDESSFEIIQAVKEYAKTDSTINKIWVRKMIRSDAESLLMIVDFKGDITKPFSGIAIAAKPLLNGTRLELLPYGEGFAKEAIKDINPFYQK